MTGEQSARRWRDGGEGGGSTRISPVRSLSRDQSSPRPVGNIVELHIQAASPPRNREHGVVQTFLSGTVEHERKPLPYLKQSRASGPPSAPLHAVIARSASCRRGSGTPSGSSPSASSTPWDSSRSAAATPWESSHWPAAPPQASSPSPAAAAEARYRSCPITPPRRHARTCSGHLPPPGPVGR